MSIELEHERNLSSIHDTYENLKAKRNILYSPTGTQYKYHVETSDCMTINESLLTTSLLLMLLLLLLYQTLFINYVILESYPKGTDQPYETFLEDLSLPPSIHITFARLFKFMPPTLPLLQFIPILIRTKIIERGGCPRETRSIFSSPSTIEIHLIYLGEESAGFR